LKEIKREIVEKIKERMFARNRETERNSIVDGMLIYINKTNCLSHHLPNIELLHEFAVWDESVGIWPRLLLKLLPLPVRHLVAECPFHIVPEFMARHHAHVMAVTLPAKPHDLYAFTLHYSLYRY
jgi:hypothetical protein